MDFNITVAMDIQVKNDNDDGFTTAVVVYFNITSDIDVSDASFSSNLLDNL